MSDKTIKRKIMDQFAWDNRINPAKIDVDVNDAVVTLKGAVPTFSAKTAAEQTAWSLTKVKAVNNQLAVEYPATFTTPTDEDIKAYINQALVYNSDVDQSNIKVEVAAGNVTLAGNVASFWEKAAVENQVKATTGVIDIKNELVVVPTEKITDEVIGEIIMNKLKQNSGLNTEKIDLKVVNGKVTVSGAVSTWADWQTVYNAIQYTGGVIDIKDNLRINYP